MALPLPTLNHTVKIVAGISDNLAKLNAHTDEGLRAIDLLQERCTALISAAVTGQIDVRG